MAGKKIEKEVTTAEATTTATDDLKSLLSMTKEIIKAKLEEKKQASASKVNSYVLKANIWLMEEKKVEKKAPLTMDELRKKYGVDNYSK